MTEFRLYDTPGSEVAQLTTDGTTIKPFLNTTNAVVDKAKLHVTTNGLEVTAVDPANVYMGNIELPASAFDAYDVESETTLGVNITALKSLVRRARKHSNDELTLSLRERELTATVSRGYENHDVVSQGTMDLIDPDAIRQEPDIPELEWSVDTEVDAAPLKDALSYAVGAADHVEIAAQAVNQHAHALYFGGETDTREESAAISNVELDNTATSMYSKDYLVDILSGVGEVDAESVRFRIDEEYPLRMEMENTSTGLSVDYYLAPRLTDA